MLAPPSARAFGIEAFEMQARAEGGTAETVAGSHPYDMTARIAFDEKGTGPYTEGDLRNLRISLPPGLIENPDALPKCSVASFHTARTSPFENSLSGENCFATTQIGTVTVHSSYGGGSVRTFGVFNLSPAPGVPAQFGFAPYGVPIVFSAGLRGTAGEYGIDLEARNFTQAFAFSELELTIWGTPWGVSHNGERGNCLNEAEPEFPWAKCSVGPPVAQEPKAYLTMPAACTGPLQFTASAVSWEGASSVSSASAPALQQCDSLAFDPHPAGQLTNPRTTSPSGYEFNLAADNATLLEPSRRVPSQVRDAVVTLPPGVTINPSVGAGLGACAPAQYEAETAFSPPGAGCPNNSKIGDFTVSTPLFEQRLEGAIYLAAPYQNPFGSLLAVYLVAKSSARGVLVKVAGRIEPDPATGQLTATFEDLPQLPYSDLSVHFREGQRAPLVSPSSCGAAVTRIALTPWLGALGVRESETATQVAAGIGGGACPSGTPPFAPQATGGTINSAAGAYSPFYLHLTRSDAEQEITTYSATLPVGLLGKIAGIPYCSDAAIAAAEQRSGAAELAGPSCPAASQIGRTSAGFGVGSALAYAPGRLYLAGPYRGSAFSVVAIDSALIGPFDLGVIVVRSAIRVDPVTAQVSIDSAGSDPIPHIRNGVPLHLRDIRVYIDRSETTVNPTSCEAQTFSSALTGSSAPFADPFGASATPSVRFQPFGCGSLGFKPKLGFTLRGGDRRGDFPSLRATLVPRPGDANLSSVSVNLPPSLFLEQSRVRAICTRVQLAAEACPKEADYGHAWVRTPLLAEPMRGPVYLVASANRVPDLLFDLHGQGIAIRVQGRIDSRHGGIRVRFDTVPDAPVTKFAMTMPGGKRGILVNSEFLCARPQRAAVRMVGHANRGERYAAAIGVPACRKHRPRRKRPDKRPDPGRKHK
ncbi:MAG TPA: hypothetical protein VFP21_06975 [Solirubrobacterales bacterium]|nr:hypothetical protein [Solirubrobacterales bacterium]